MSRPLRILSLGAGVQSTTVLLMSCHGVLPKLDAAIFADTGWEPRAVYEHLWWLSDYASRHGIPVSQVRAGDLRTDALVSQVRAGDLRTDALVSQVRGRRSEDGRRWAAMPMFVLNVYDERHIPAMLAKIAQREAQGKDVSRLVGVLATIRRRGTATTKGMIKRECTSEYKIEPIERFVKTELLGLQRRGRWPTELAVESWQGISADEATRMRDSDKPWRLNVYPLCGVPVDHLPKPMTRNDCKAWLRENFPDRIVPRSACIGCPFHSDAEWLEMQRNDPESFADAVEFDQRIRRPAGLTGWAYLHRSCKPLGEVDFARTENRQQSLWNQECHGMCGV